MRSFVWGSATGWRKLDFRFAKRVYHDAAGTFYGDDMHSTRMARGPLSWRNCVLEMKAH